MERLDSIEARHKIYQKFVKDFLRSGAAIDQNIGRILDVSEQMGIDKETVTIYTSDQGYFLGEHGFFDKRMIYEESLRMPCVISFPEEIVQGSANSDIILNIDFPSLFLDYAGLESPPEFQGRSFRSILKGETPSDWRKELYYRYWLHQRQRPAHYGLRTHEYKLAYFYGEPLDMPGSHPESTVPAWEFYDLNNDPNEMMNKYLDSDYQLIIDSLKEQLTLIKAAVGDVQTPVPIDR